MYPVVNKRFVTALRFVATVAVVEICFTASGCTETEGMTVVQGEQEVTCPGVLVGNPADEPSIEIMAASNTGDRRIVGKANNLDASKVTVVLFAKTDMWYVQPLVASPYTSVCSDGSWENWSHPWSTVVALLVDESYSPGATRTYHPSTDSGVLAWDEYPQKSTDRFLSFGGYEFRVKVAEDYRAGPGPNYFSGAEEDIWVDAEGLHLNIVQREDKWYCTEVVLHESLGYGTYQFKVASRIDNLDYNAVFAGFIYEDRDREVDIEFSQALADPDGAQFVVQPWYREGNLTRFTMPAEAETSHRFVWAASSIAFVSWIGHGAYPPDPGAVIHQYVYEGPDIPPPGGERFRFNLWLFDGHAPDSGRGDEVIVKSFSFVP